MSSFPDLGNTNEKRNSSLFVGKEIDRMQETEKEKVDYQKFIKENTPKRNMGVQMLKAFITGGIICTMGQGIFQFLMESVGLGKEEASTYCSMILILLSVILTGFQIYPRIVDFGGAGALVPITGFANGVAASAIEYKAQGQVYGIGCKIFTIAGPVILYGLFVSWMLGIVSYIISCA